MDITIRITVSDEVHDAMTAMTGEVGGVEELLVHTTVTNNDFVMSAVILRTEKYSIGGLYTRTELIPDETTRQSR